MKHPEVRPESCSWYAHQAKTPLAGTASTSLGYVCVEHNGPWGPKILKNVEYGPIGTPAAELAAHLSDNLPAGVTPLLIRRFESKHGIPSPAVVMVVALTPHGGRGLTRQVDSLDELVSIDFRALINHARIGSTPEGWEELGATYLVCTHAKRDQCCAVLGRPVVGALTELRPGTTWEVSHVGGHRLAANLVALPDGVHYGQMVPAKVPTLVRAHESGALLVENMRGRASLAPAVQAAEIALRRHLDGGEAADAVRLVSVTSSALEDSDAPPDHGPLTTSIWEADGARWKITVITATTAGPLVPISCETAPVTPPPEQRVRAVSRMAVVQP